MSNNDLEAIKRKVLLQIELDAKSLLQTEKALDNLRKASALTDASDEVSIELDDLVTRAVARASEDVEGVQ